MWKEQPRKKLQCALFPPAWKRILEARVPLYVRLPEPDRKELEGLAHVFLEEKNFEGCGGLTTVMKTKYAGRFGEFLFKSSCIWGSLCAALCLGDPAMAASPPGAVVGKVTVGYQGWFACVGDGAPIDSWWHYSGTSTPPTPTTLSNSIHCWPDMRQFSGGYQTAYSNFSNGQQATLFSSYDQQTVNTHFRWMAENGVDTAALQRFNPFGSEGPVRNAISTKVMNAAQTHGVKFYIMYDCSGWPSNTFVSDIESDWTNVIINTLHLTNSPAYAMQNGKPVVCIWGFGFNDANHPWPTNVCIQVINYFKSQGCYVIGGVPTWWREGVSDSQPDFLAAYSAFNMLSPWMVGRIGDSSGSDWFRANVNEGDVAYCSSLGIDYQPCVLPGDSGSRAHGDFMWHQFGNMIQIGAQGLYISMFDEFNEGNQIACTAEDASMEPAGTSSLYFTLDQDGVHCSSDYYLRLTGDGDKMLKGQIPFTFTRPTVPALPLILPAAPTGLTAQVGNRQATLNWTAVTGAADVLSYNIKRATLSGGSYATVATNVGLISFTDTNLSNGTAYYYVVSAVNSLGESADSGEASVTPQTLYEVNSGGSGADSFMSDSFYSSGSTSSTSSGIDTSGVTNPAPQTVYQTMRWNNNTYTFTNLIMGASYKVKLHFAETYWNSAGIRLFNVYINGAQVLANYDVLAAAGAKNKAIIKEFTTTPNSSSQIDIQYSNIAGKDNAMSSGVEILPLLSAPTGLTATVIATGQVKLSWAVSTNATAYNVKQAIASGGPYTAAASLTSLAYTYTNVTNGTLYYFVVSATNAFGESVNSTQVSARPVATTAPQLTFVTSGGQISLSWPTDHTGWRLQMQTNSIGSALGTDWATVSGSTATNQIFAPINGGGGNAFFRLVYP